MKNVPSELNTITDVVLAYKPPEKAEGADNWIGRAVRRDSANAPDRSRKRPAGGKDK